MFSGKVYKEGVWIHVPTLAMLSPLSRRGEGMLFMALRNSHVHPSCDLLDWNFQKTWEHESASSLRKYGTPPYLYHSRPHDPLGFSLFPLPPTSSSSSSSSSPSKWGVGGCVLQSPRHPSLLKLGFFHNFQYLNFYCYLESEMSLPHFPPHLRTPLLLPFLFFPPPNSSQSSTKRTTIPQPPHFSLNFQFRNPLFKTRLLCLSHPNVTALRFLSHPISLSFLSPKTIGYLSCGAHFCAKSSTLTYSTTLDFEFKDSHFRRKEIKTQKKDTFILPYGWNAPTVKGSPSLSLSAHIRPAVSKKFGREKERDSLVGFEISVRNLDWLEFVTLQVSSGECISDDLPLSSPPSLPPLSPERDLPDKRITMVGTSLGFDFNRLSHHLFFRYHLPTSFLSSTIGIFYRIQPSKLSSSASCDDSTCDLSKKSDWEILFGAESRQNVFSYFCGLGVTYSI